MAIQPVPLWTSTEGRLWMIENGKPTKYLWATGIHRIFWNENKKPRIILNSYLPMGFWLLDTRHKFDMEIHSGKCRDLSDPEEGIILARMTGCEIIQRWIPHLVEIKDGVPDGISIYANVECDLVEFLR